MDSIRAQRDASLVSISAVPDEPGFAARVFKAIADAEINVDMIVQDAGVRGKANLSFTVQRDELDRCVELLNQLAEGNAFGPVTSRRDIAKLSVAGVGLRSHTEVADRLFNSLVEARVNVALINTSEVLINVIVSLGEADRARVALEKEFADMLMPGV